VEKERNNVTTSYINTIKGFSSMKRIIALTLLLLISNFALAASPYITVIDAGSTGSRAFLFQLIKEKPIAIRTIAIARIKPGISDYVKNPEIAGNKILNLLDKLYSSRKVDKKSIPTYIYATGRMRTMPQSKSKPILDAVRKRLVSSDFTHIKEIALIKGKREGLYQWLTINYLLGNFIHTDRPKVAILEAGASSVQIAFTDREKKGTKNTTPNQEKQKEFRVFSLSFPLAGLNEVEARVNAQKANKGSCYAGNYFNNDASFDWKKCNDKIASAILPNNVLPKSVKRKFKHSLSQNTPIIATAGFYYTAALLDYSSLTSLKEVVNEKCSLPWTELRETYKDNPSLRFLPPSCLRSTYIYRVLHDKFGIPLNYPHLSFKGNINNHPISWTLGVAYLAYRKQN
jgi:hypothetical protein